MADLFRHAEKDLEAYVQAFSAVPGQVGAIFALGGKVVGFEMLFSPDTFAKLLGKLVRSYALDAIEIPGDHSPMPPADSAVSLLKRVAAAEVQEALAVGLGRTLRITATGLVGIGLQTEDALIHRRIGVSLFGAVCSAEPAISGPGQVRGIRLKVTNLATPPL